MIAESVLALGIVGGTAFKILDTNKVQRKLKKNIKKLWQEVMDGIGTKAENKIEVEYTLLDIFPKHYGFDAIVELPYGKSLSDFIKIVPTLESAFNSDVVAEYSTNKNSLYIRCKLISIKQINPKDDIRIKFAKVFTDRNVAGETYTIKKMTDILNPNLADKEYSEQIIGYKLIINIPHGLNYDTLVKYEPNLNNTFSKVFVNWNTTTDRAEIDIIVKPLDNKEKWTTIPCKPYELYTAMTYSYKPVIMDFKVSQGLIDGGQNGTGKTVAIISSFINLITQHTRDDFRMCIASIADKQDLRILAKANQCDYYARNIGDSLKLMRYLNKENARRSLEFERCKKYTANIFEYNANNKKDKLPFIYFITDEIADFMEEPHDSDKVKTQKKEFQSLFWKLTRQGRSQGIWCVAGTQRGDVENMKANTKSNLSNKMCFYQANISSAQTIFGNGDSLCTRVTKLVKANRECLIEYSEGITIAKTLFITNDMMANFVKPYSVANKEYLNLNSKGEIEEITEQEGENNYEKQDKNVQKGSKNIENNTKGDKNNSKNAEKRNNAINNIKNNLKNK